MVEGEDECLGGLLVLKSRCVCRVRGSVVSRIAGDTAKVGVVRG